MKKILLSSVALLGLTAGAMAADLPSRRAPAPYVAVPVFTWTGFYIGANAGYGFDTGSNSNGAFAVGPATGTGRTLSGPLAPYNGTVVPGATGSTDGFVGGGQIGYNYQIGNIVVGIEADAQYADLAGNRSGVTALAPAVAGFAGAVGNRGGIDWFGTVRGRVGYAWDRLLVFGTGGFAYGDGSDTCNSTFAAGRCTGNNGLRTGWTAGGGVEYAFTPNLTGKLEALYVNLDRNSASSRYVGDFVAAGAVTPVFVNGRRSRDDEFVVVRAGLNYKFNTFGF
jgi:outer membrane immunogenic protein